VKLLADTDGDGEIDDVVATTTTSNGGQYLFENLDADDYKVMFGTVAGLTFTTAGAAADEDVDGDSDAGVDGMTDTISLEIGEAERDIDAGLVDPGTASIGDTVWFDADKDGLLGADEEGVDGVEVKLLADTDGDGEIDDVVATTTTANGGQYLFDGLAAGEYKVMFGTAGDLVFTGASRNPAEDVDGDSDANETDGMTDVITLSTGEAERDVDAGLIDPGTASVGDTVWLDANGNGILDGGEAGVDGVEVKLLADLDGDGEVDDVVATTTTANGGQYLFDGLDAGEYAVMFVEPNGFDFTATGADADDLVDGDSDAGVNGMTDTFDLSIGEAETDIDAGLVSENGAPTPMDDELKICADTVGGVSVLLNDTDPEFDLLSIVEVDGQAIAPFGSITTANGTEVTLDDLLFLGQSLSIDATGSAVWSALDIGEMGVENISYTVTDGNGNFATANLEVTFCGDANSVSSLNNSLPTGLVEYQISSSSVEAPYGDEGFDIKIVSAGGDGRFEDVIFEEAYCLSIIDPAAAAENFGTAPINTADAFGIEDATASLFNADQISFANGETALDNLDVINWILNQDFEDNGFTGWEVQRAIWEFTDSFDTDYLSDIDPALGDDANVDFIVSQALANGDGFVAGVGDVVGVVLDPNPATAENSQPFLVAVDWEDVDCFCIDNSGMILS
ncbi:hypothetical protein E4Z66_16650, partial [Aliishimia ponticola]